jgi:hypothetical protein
LYLTQETWAFSQALANGVSPLVTMRSVVGV